MNRKVQKYQGVPRLGHLQTHTISSQPRYDHFDTSPLLKAWLLYQHKHKKSRLFLCLRLLFCQFKHGIQLTANGFIVFSPMGTQASGAILDPIIRILKVSSASVPQGIQRTETEQAAEALMIRPQVTRKIRTIFILEKIVICHTALLFIQDKMCYHEAGR